MLLCVFLTLIKQKFSKVPGIGGLEESFVGKIEEALALRLLGVCHRSLKYASALLGVSEKSWFLLTLRRRTNR